jgi:hypothetical protein
MDVGHHAALKAKTLDRQPPDRSRT